MAALSAEELFRDFFLPLYPEDARKDLRAARAVDANPAKNPAIFAHIEEAAELFAARGEALFDRDLTLDFTDASVHRLSVALTAARRDAWASAGEKGTPENELFNVVVHGAAYVGACIARNHGGTWSARRPLWESVVRLVSRAGEADLAVFHWWLKALTAEGAESSTLADRYRALVEIPCARPEELPVIAEEERRLPRIEKVRYDVLYKYLKAHLPELRDLGKDFPSPERFQDYGFKSLGLMLIGGGRMLLMHGHTDHGAHLFWLTAGGFEKAAFYPCDSFPEHQLKVSGDKLQLIVNADKKMVVHEMLWWGP